jgi:hypothetical protein
MTKVEPITNESVQSRSEVVREQPLSPTPIDRILGKLSCMELPAKEHFERNSLVPILPVRYRHVNLNCYTGPLELLPYPR